MSTNNTDVLIVGAGPTGLTLAIDLGRRGIRCTIVEQKEAPAFLPKMERANARTMEIYRRMGLADRIRAAGLRADCRMDVYVILAMNRPPLLRLPYPSVAQAKLDIRATTDGSAPLEPYQLISQYTLEPLLKSVAEAMPGVTVRFGCEFVSLRQDPQGVTATVKSHGGTEQIRAAYLVGCDGGASPVRHAVGIKLRGEGNSLALRQALFRCDTLFEQIPIGNGPGQGRHYHVADDKATQLIMQDFDPALDPAFDRGFGRGDEGAVREDGRDPGRLRDAVLQSVAAEPAARRALPGRPGAARRRCRAPGHSDRRARHELRASATPSTCPGSSPARCRAGAAPSCLPAYEFERRQIGDRNVGASRYATIGRRKWRSLWRPDIADDTPAGRQTREVLVASADIEQRKTNEMIGAELGYRYVDSPIICDIPGGPEHLFREYHPTTWPGARLPHVWLDDGTALQDRIGDGYTILRLGRSQADTGGLERALRAHGAPVAVLDIPDEIARDVYDYDLLLLRPDLHVVWRGREPPEDPAEVAAIATGH